MCFEGPSLRVANFEFDAGVARGGVDIDATGFH